MKNYNKQRQEAKLKGEIFYFTGKPCKNGHLSKRYTKWSICVECDKLNKKTKYKEEAKVYGRQYSYKKLYGITISEYDRLFKEQKGLCAICKQKETLTLKGKIKRLSVDHCHETKKVGRLLCGACNQGIGKFKHNPELLRMAALYCEATR